MKRLSRLFSSPVEGYIFLRLLMGVVLLALATEGAWGTESLSRLAFQTAALTFLVMGVSAALVRRYGQTTRFLWAQMVIDTIFATALVSLSHGPQSSYFMLYFMSIVAAARLLPGLGVVVVAILDTGAYALVSLAGLAGLLAWDLSPNMLELYTQVLLRCFALLLVGFFSVGLVPRKDLLSQVQRYQSLQKEHTALLDRLQVAILTAEAGRFTSQNDAAKLLLGEVIGRPTIALFPHEEDRWEQTLSKDGPQETGDARLLACRRDPLEGGGQVYIVEDITRLREMESQIEREERLAAVGRLAASLAHEIRNPLASLSGSVQLLEEREPNPLQRIILREVQRLNELVEEFLQSSRPLQLTPVRLDPRPILQEVLAAFENDPRCRGQRTLRSALDEVPPVLLDPGPFRQVIWNLLVNAAQATPAGGTIEVRTQAAEGAAQVVVRDDGVGIPPEKLLRVFDPFYTTRAGGTGLGLANVDRIVRAHGGTVHVESVPGEGATFTLSLPAAPPPHAQQELK